MDSEEVRRLLSLQSRIAEGVPPEPQAMILEHKLKDRLPPAERSIYEYITKLRATCEALVVKVEQVQIRYESYEEMAKERIAELQQKYEDANDAIKMTSDLLGGEIHLQTQRADSAERRLSLAVGALREAKEHHEEASADYKHAAEAMAMPGADYLWRYHRDRAALLSATLSELEKLA